jgi:7,8-dihydropterin-6-yl-methyl-4-(beta-D-ribofuranosyl)aminobenzene 5'-phosphate synthase
MRNRGSGEQSVGRIKDFGVVQSVEITVLVDNSADLMVRSTETAKRFTKEPLLAEHGFAALVDLEEAGERILWDAGISQMALLENAQRMEIDLAAVDKIALSHGHGDHYAAMTNVIGRVARKPEPREWAKDTAMDEIRTWAKGQKVPLIAHPAAFRERWGIAKDGKKYGPHNVPREEWDAAGAEIVLSEGPYRLGPGCWTTGTIPRNSFEQAGVPSSLAYREGDEFIADRLDDDQAVVIHVQGKGLVVLTGCAHSGVINTIRYAREISGVDEVFAILGGFHLGRAKDDEIERTIDEIVGMLPELVVPTHCTGFKATARIAERMPDQFVQGVVGTKYLLRSGS